MRQLLSLTVLALAASFAQAQIRVGDIQPCQGPLGPAREPVYDRYDDVFVRGKIIGAKTNTDGIVSVDVQADILGPDGNKLEHTSGTVKYPLPLNDQVPLNFNFAVKPTWAPGKCMVKITVKDNESGSETSFTQDFTVLAPRLAILPPQFFFDKEGQNQAPNGGFLAQTIYYKWWVVGLDISKGSVDCDVVTEIRDRTGKNVLREIMKLRNKESDSEKLKKLTYMTNTGNLPLGSPGDFVLHMVAMDNMAGKVVTCDFPLHIEAPGMGPRFEGGSREVSLSPPPSLIQVSSPPK
jgi:hypothetical protein